MAEDAITIALQGESCTISIDPSAYLRVKIYVPGVKPCPLVLQGPSDERSRFPRQTSTTFLLPAVGEKIRIDAYSGDGEGTLLNHTYEREESGLVLKEGYDNDSSIFGPWMLLMHVFPLKYSLPLEEPHLK